MADLQRITHGEPNWDVKVNAIIDNVNGLGNKVGNMKWTAATADGMVFQNGFYQLNSGIQSSYRYVQFDGWKLVDLQIAVGLTTAPSTDAEVVAVKLPDAVGYDGWNEWSSSNGYQLTLNGNEFRVSKQGSSWWTGSGSHYIAHVLYAHVG